MKGGQRRDTVKGALPDDLGFAVGSQVIWYFLPGSPGKQSAQGGAQMDWRGFGKERGVTEASGYHEITPGKKKLNVIRQKR